MRINKWTLCSAERTDKPLNFTGVFTYFVECAKQGSAEVFGFFEEPVMRSVFAGIVPNPFGGVEFWPIGRQLEHLQLAAVLGKEVIGLVLFMIGGVVLD